MNAPPAAPALQVQKFFSPIDYNGARAKAFEWVRANPELDIKGVNYSIATLKDGSSGRILIRHHVIRVYYTLPA